MHQTLTAVPELWPEPNRALTLTLNLTSVLSLTPRRLRAFSTLYLSVRLRGGLARFLGGSEGAPRQLLLLQELRTEVLRYLPPSHRAQPVPQALDPRPRTLCPRP